MMAARKESSIVTSILKYLNSLPDCKAEKTHGGQYGNSGKPDVTGCYNGRRLEFEVKRLGNAATDLQKVTLKEWQRAGAVVAVVYSKDEVKEIMEGLIADDLRTMRQFDGRLRM